MFNSKFSALFALTLAAAAIAGPAVRDVDEDNNNWTVNCNLKRAAPTAAVDNDNNNWTVNCQPTAAVADNNIRQVAPTHVARAD
ncbi:hypothetical protein B0H11DRAFT_2041104 [Mycena galericulata]|nr:hypothetical protein B0H11DRAFT_2041104 [Mycena galericulata]